MNCEGLDYNIRKQKELKKKRKELKQDPDVWAAEKK